MSDVESTATTCLYLSSRSVSSPSSLIPLIAITLISIHLTGMPMRVEKAKIAILEFPLKQYRAHMGVQILVTEADELEKIRLK